MKTLHTIASSYVTKSEPHLVHFVALADGVKAIDPPALSTAQPCDFCGSNEWFTPHYNTDKNDERRIKICAGLNCVTTNASKIKKATTTPPQPKRAILWGLFCEFNDIGDVHHHVLFEQIQQSASKLNSMKEFALNPQNLFLFQGDTGTGKTFAALGICELFTRSDSSCMFITQKKMLFSWLEAQKDILLNGFIDKVRSVRLLVVDDFGIAEISPGFLSWFFDTIDYRLQWKNKGTIITTNLKEKDFAALCGEAFIDRIFSAKLFSFTGKSRRSTKKL